MGTRNTSQAKIVLCLFTFSWLSATNSGFADNKEMFRELLKQVDALITQHLLTFERVDDFDSSCFQHLEVLELWKPKYFEDMVSTIPSPNRIVLNRTIVIFVNKFSETFEDVTKITYSDIRYILIYGSYDHSDGQIMEHELTIYPGESLDSGFSRWVYEKYLRPKNAIFEFKATVFRRTNENPEDSEECTIITRYEPFYGDIIGEDYVIEDYAEDRNFLIRRRSALVNP